MARRGRLMLPGPADAYSSMVSAEDAAAAVVAALDVPAGTYTVVESDPLTRGEHAEVLAGLLGRSRVRPLPAIVGRMPTLRVMARSHRMSNAALVAVSGWRPQHPSVREGWAAILEELGDDR